ncbi:MAG: glycosyltransferase, partial [Bacteroidota bacterium]|nr:glycosyltransferase [Bacteroidota bacterium]
MGVFILERIYHIQRPWLNKKSLERTQSVDAKAKTEGISLVLCVYNEAKHLKQYLESWINIDYPNLELIIINDGSDDNSLDIIHQLTKDLTNIQVYTITHQGKKKALETGIQKSTYPCIALTDIDCFPNSNQWLQYMVKQFKKRGCLVGFAPYHYEKHSLLNGLMQFDMKLLGEDYLKAASQGKSYM